MAVLGVEYAFTMHHSFRNGVEKGYVMEGEVSHCQHRPVCYPHGGGG